jgi:plastocyanin
MAMNAANRFSGRSVRLASVTALAALALLVPAGRAQQDEGPHPSHIHSGTCAELGDVVVPLTDVAPVAADVERSGPVSAIPVKHSVTVVDMPLQEIIDGGHAVNVHLSAEEIGTYIACGDIGGPVTTDEGEQEPELVIGLRELNDSGHTGIAWLGAEGDSTRVAVHLVEPESAAMAGEEATPAASATDGAEALTVEIKDFAFNPPTIEVPAGGSVTWTNQDSAPHTATGFDREVLQSGTLDAGESFTQQFDTAGTFEYFCEFHANMKGSIVVG